MGAGHGASPVPAIPEFVGAAKGSHRWFEALAVVVVGQREVQHPDLEQFRIQAPDPPPAPTWRSRDQGRYLLGLADDDPDRFVLATAIDRLLNGPCLREVFDRHPGQTAVAFVGTSQEKENEFSVGDTEIVAHALARATAQWGDDPAGAIAVSAIGSPEDELAMEAALGEALPAVLEWARPARVYLLRRGGTPALGEAAQQVLARVVPSGVDLVRVDPVPGGVRRRRVERPDPLLSGTALPGVLLWRALAEGSTDVVAAALESLVEEGGVSAELLAVARAAVAVCRGQQPDEDDLPGPLCEAIGQDRAAQREALATWLRGRFYAGLGGGPAPL